MIWGAAIIISVDSLGANAMQLFVYALPLSRFQIAGLFVGGAGLAMYAMRYREYNIGMLSMLCFLPQQLLILGTAFPAVSSIIREQFGDGVLRPFWFIFTGEIWSILLAVFYFGALTHHFTRRAHCES